MGMCVGNRLCVRLPQLSLLSSFVRQRYRISFSIDNFAVAVSRSDLWCAFHEPIINTTRCAFCLLHACIQRFQKAKRRLYSQPFALNGDLLLFIVVVVAAIQFVHSIGANYFGGFESSLSEFWSVHVQYTEVYFIYSK